MKNDKRQGPIIVNPPNNSSKRRRKHVRRKRKGVKINFRRDTNTQYTNLRRDISRWGRMGGVISCQFISNGP